MRIKTGHPRFALSESSVDLACDRYDMFTLCTFGINLLCLTPNDRVYDDLCGVDTLIRGL